MTYGDIFQLGAHRLMCGDSTKLEDVEQLMNGEKADMVFTDPPYNLKYQSHKRKTERFKKINNDNKILNFFPIITTYNNGFVFICTTWKILDKWLPLFNQYYELTNMIIWHKMRGGMGDLKRTFSTDYEILLVSHNKRKILGKRIGSVWSIPCDQPSTYKHPTQKPVKLSAIAIKSVTNENDIVLDLFGGSGSTLLACEQLNRRCYMMEIDEDYIKVIIERWEKITGKKAKKISKKSEYGGKNDD